MTAHDTVKHAVQFYTHNERLSEIVAKAVLTDLKAAGYTIVRPVTDEEEAADVF